MKKLALLFLILLSSCLYLPPSIPSPNSLADKTVALVIADDDGELHIYCSGTWISDTKILTAAHCVSHDPLLALLGVKEPALQYKTELGKPALADLVKVDDELDLAVIQARELPKPHAVAELAKYVERGQRIFTMGHPLGFGWSYIPGYVSAIRDEPLPNGNDRKVRQLQVDVDNGPGNSGCAIFDMDGNIVGVQSWGPRKIPMHFAIHRDMVEEFLAKH